MGGIGAIGGAPAETKPPKEKYDKSNKSNGLQDQKVSPKKPKRKVKDEEKEKEKKKKLIELRIDKIKEIFSPIHLFFENVISLYKVNNIEMAPDNILRENIYRCYRKGLS